MATTGASTRPKPGGGGGEPTEPKPWYEANMGPLPAGISTVNHNLGLTNPDEIVVQFWDSGGIEPLIANVTNRTANTLDLDLEMPSAGDVHVVVARSQAN